MPLNSISIPTSGLRTAQRNLSTTGHNMSNVSTEGFSRQRINQGAFAYNNIGRTHTNITQVGMGVDIMGVQQLRNKFLDLQFRAEIGRANFYDNMYRTSHDIEISMGEFTNSSSGVQVTRQLWNSLQELSLNPSGMDQRANFISAVTAYVDRMEDTARRLREQKNVINGEVKEMVDEINNLLHTIDQLNHRIAQEEAFGQSANDFRDSRHFAMDRLAALLDVNFHTNQLNGHVEITSNGFTLLAGSNINEIGLRFTEIGSDFVEPVIGGGWDRPLPFDPTFSNARSLLRLDRVPVTHERPGGLMGLVQARGLTTTHHASPYLTFPRYDATGQPDRLGMHVFVDGQLTMLSPDQMSRSQSEWERRNAFNADHAIIARTLRHLDITFNHTVSMVNEFLTNTNATTNPASWGADPAAGNNTINLWGADGIPIFVTRDDTRINEEHLRGEYIAGVWTPLPNLNTLQFTLGNVTINPDLLTPDGYNRIGLSTIVLDRDDPGVILDLLDAWQTGMFVLDGSAPLNLDDLYNEIVLRLALETQSLRNLRETQQGIAEEIHGQRHRAMGVSLDEEMTNMMLFQHSFNAASRVITVIDEMIQTVLNI